MGNVKLFLPYLWCQWLVCCRRKVVLQPLASICLLEWGTDSLVAPDAFSLLRHWTSVCICQRCSTQYLLEIEIRRSCITHFWKKKIFNTIKISTIFLSFHIDSHFQSRFLFTLQSLIDAEAPRVLMCPLFSCFLVSRVCWRLATLASCFPVQCYFKALLLLCRKYLFINCGQQWHLAMNPIYHIILFFPSSHSRTILSVILNE